MEHVSTLCAASTVGVAATGFALGRVERPSSSKPYAPRRKTRSLQLHSPPVTNASNPICSDHRPRSSRLSAVVEATFGSKPVSGKNDRRHNVSEQCEPGVPDPGKELPPYKMSGLRRFRRRGYTNPVPKSVDERPTASHSRRPSSSWLRRLSISSSNNLESPSPGPTPTSSTFGGSTNSNLARPSSQRKSPGKLVKRSSSQLHPLSHAAPSTSSASAPLRRPNTSYQRIGPPSRPGSTPAETPVPAKSRIWRPYLTSTPIGPAEKLVRPLSSSGDTRNHGLRLVLPPDADTIPALLLASSVTKGEPVETCRISTAPAGFHHQFRDPFKHVDSSIQPAERPSRPETASGISPGTVQGIVPEMAPVTASGTVLPGRRNSQLPVLLSENDPTMSVPGGPDSRSSRNVGGGCSSFPRSRRNATDPCAFRRPQSASSPVSLATESSELRKSLMSLSLSRASSDMSHLRDITRRSSTSDAIPLSPSDVASYRLNDSNSHLPFRQRMKRLSTATSDPASTVISSDDTHTFTSGGEDETDFMSETAFDSIRTYATASTYSKPHGPRIDKVFDDENVPSKMLKGRLASLEELLPRGSFSANPSNGCSHDGSDDENGRSAAVQTGVAEMMGGQGYPATAKEPETISVTRSVSLTSNLSDARSSVGPLPGEMNGLFSRAIHSASPSAIRKEVYNDSRDLFCTTTTQHTHNPITSGISNHDQPKTNIFDWSEQPKTDRCETAGSEARPNTVHGKQGGIRGSRPPVRKAPNALHLRSQSVPSRDSAMNEPFQASTKFGTWGLGSKGVSEDWDNDFEFDDVEENSPNKKVVGQRGMIVPQAIMERQASLHGQFGQVQELTMLVEELKRLRHRASLLRVAHGSSSELWKEAEGIINLATVDDDDNSHSPPRSPSSLTFSFDDSEDSHNLDDSLKQSSEESWRRPPSEGTDPSRSVSPSQPLEGPTAKSMSVMDLIYQRRTSPDPLRLDTSVSLPQKLPFDTQSLQSLVVRAGVVTRALKEVIRKAEGVTTAPESSILQPAPAFSRIFEQPPAGFF